LAGEDKKTLTIFSTLAKNSVKFFSQRGFTRAFPLLFANLPEPCRNRYDTPCVNEKTNHRHAEKGFSLKLGSDSCRRLGFYNF